MNIRHSVLGLVGLGLCSWLGVAGAWQVELRNAATESGPDRVWVSNRHTLKNADVYLAWFDSDGQGEKTFQTWQLNKGWQPGLKPLAGGPLDLEAFEALPVTGVPDECPEEHRCFLAMVAVEHNRNPLDIQDWQQSALLPLTAPAARERMPGQTYFLPPVADETRVSSGDLEAVQNDGGDAASIASPAPTADSDNSGSGAAETEKPDIFRLEGTRVLYANSQAQRFQVIDVSDPTTPVLAASAALSGQPLEVYSLNDYYVVLQSDNVIPDFVVAMDTAATSEEARPAAGTRVTLLQDDGEGTLSVAAEHTLSGNFIESRRRNDVIYTVAGGYDGETGYVLKITALKITAEGAIEELTRLDVPAYSPEVAIFSDYLVVTGHDNESWRNSVVQVFKLTDATQPLQALRELTVPGRIPSEFHVNVADTHLHVVYGPEDREAGSTLAVYDLANELAEVGSVGSIAPGEQLYATRFHGQYAYVVTFERTDPLWVIDLADPSQPVIKGELIVPGWSEKLFFNDNRLFAVGIDQPAPEENAEWRRLVAISMFDVADPTAPALLGRYTPLLGEVTYSWSPALDDERALLLDWEESYAALPINSWEIDNGSFVQLVDFAGNVPLDAGSLNLPVSVQRTVELDTHRLGVLGNQIFLTLEWGQGDPVQLGEVELAQNLTWLELAGNDLWAAASGDRGLHRVYRYRSDDLENPMQRWALERAFQGAISAGDLQVLYSVYPMAVQVLDRADGTLWDAVLLEEEENTGRDWYPHGQPLIHNNTFYVATQQTLYPQKPDPEPMPMPEPDPIVLEEPMDSNDTRPLRRAGMPALSHPVMLPDMPAYQSQWVLRSWTLSADGAQPLAGVTIPGEPLAFTTEGRLLTREAAAEGMRLNLVALDGDSVNLLGSLFVECAPYANSHWNGEALYLTCEQGYYYPTISRVETTDGFAPQEPVPPKLLKVGVDGGLSIAGEWTFERAPYVLDSDEETVLVRHGYGYGGIAYTEPMVDVAVSANMSIMPPIYQENCSVYDLSGSEPALVRQLDNCPWNNAVALSADSVYTARGYAGLSAEAINP